jgi:hypothetical protein
VRQLDSRRIVTASFGGHDLTEQDIRDALIFADLDFLAPHRPRYPKSPSETEIKTRECLSLMKKVGRIVPVHHQEPFRRGYTDWEPLADDFLTDLNGAIAGDAAGWCFHNGAQKQSVENRPRRCFDLSTQNLFEQLDAEERKVIAGITQMKK